MKQKKKRKKTRDNREQEMKQKKKRKKTRDNREQEMKQLKKEVDKLKLNKLKSLKDKEELNRLNVKMAVYAYAAETASIGPKLTNLLLDYVKYSKKIKTVRDWDQCVKNG
eukprot:771966_1